MASLVSRPNGRKEVQFTDTDGSRKTIRLGKMNLKDAQPVLTQVEMMLSAKGLGAALKPQSVEWLKTIDSRIHARTGEVWAHRDAEVGHPRRIHQWLH